MEACTSSHFLQLYYQIPSSFLSYDAILEVPASDGWLILVGQIRAMLCHLS